MGTSGHHDTISVPLTLIFIFLAFGVQQFYLFSLRFKEILQVLDSLFVLCDLLFLLCLIWDPEKIVFVFNLHANYFVCCIIILVYLKHITRRWGASVERRNPGISKWVVARQFLSALLHTTIGLIRKYTSRLSRKHITTSCRKTIGSVDKCLRIHWQLDCVLKRTTKEFRATLFLQKSKKFPRWFKPAFFTLG